MLTKKQIQEAIIERAVVFDNNGGDVYHVDGIFRGLLWALNGEDPGTNLSMDMANVFTLAGIANTITEDGRVQFSL